MASERMAYDPAARAVEIKQDPIAHDLAQSLNNLADLHSAQGCNACRNLYARAVYTKAEGKYLEFLDALSSR